MPKGEISAVVANNYRTHTCGDVRRDHIGKTVKLAGWVHSRRDHGGLVFIDLRDRWGLTQLTFHPDSKSTFTQAESLRTEWVIQVEGEVVERPKEMINDKLATGSVEVVVSDLVILNQSQTPPFEISSDVEINEELRLEYRYLDLRRERMQKNIMLRHRMLQAVRGFFYDRGFLEIETPMLIKNTPEGAREYVVPSRVHPGQFYVLPQSPQQLKQLSMAAGFDKYMQIARCFRDEDQRGDRQPEFTQVDIEMSYVSPEDIMAVTEECLIYLTETLRPDISIQTKPFPRLTWKQALGTYGSDKPDLRYDLLFVDVSEACRGCGFGVFADAIEQGGVVLALRVPGGATFTRSDIDALTETAKVYGGRGLAWIKVTQDGYEGVPVAKLGSETTKHIANRAKAEPGDLLLFAADAFEVACISLGAVRTDVANRLELVPKNTFAFCWVNDFPMFEKDAESGELVARHHPFTRPVEADIEKLANNPLAATAQAYDIALNGYEIGGGSIRIHEPDLQQHIFDAMGISPEDSRRRFGHILKAFTFGVPPHGGIAWGFDRLVMLFADEPNIREVIAYPKDQKAKDLMLGAPSAVDKPLLKDLHIEVDLEG